jgi:hypothetical protein
MRSPNNIQGTPWEKIEVQILPYKLRMVRVSLITEVNLRISQILKKKQFNLQEELDLIPLLDEAWERYRMRGAIFISPWTEEVAELFDTKSPWKYRLTMLRTVNPLLVLNILGRSRAKLLLPNVPVSLEPQFLARDVISTDPRLIQIIRAEAGDE